MRTSVIAAMTVLAMAVGYAQGSPLPDAASSANRVAIPQIGQAPRLEEFATGQPMGTATQLAHISAFRQNQPINGAAPLERTDTWLGYTPSTFYAVFICYDSRPATVRAHLARRENIAADDFVSILFDPFADHRRGILFELNPLGVQADALWTEGQQQPDFSYDQVWDSDARRFPGGWMVLFAIPFRSIRSNPAQANWGVVLGRSLPRNSEQDFWPNVNANISGVLPQEGTLAGIAGVAASHNIQIDPYALAHNQHTLNFRDPLDPYFSNRRLAGTVGGDAKIILKDTLVLDATVNPDFSQIESDEPQFTVNQRFPVYFPELRPFFLENANYFATPIAGVYTRNILRPEFGARLTGKIGHTNLGILAINDCAPGQDVANSDPLFGKKAAFTIARVSEDVGVESNIGVAYAGREFGGGWNRVGSLDFNVRLDPHWSTVGEVLESSTQVPGQPYSAGPATYLEFIRQGHAFNFDNTIKDYSPGFQTQTGFIRLNNVRENINHTNYFFYPKRGVLQTYGVQANNVFAWDHQNNRLFHYSELDLISTFRRNTVFVLFGGENSDTLGPANYPLLTRNLNVTENYAGVNVQTSPIPQLTLSVVGTHGGNPNYNPANSQLPKSLLEEFVQAKVTLQPVRALTIDNTYLLDRNHNGGNQNPFVFENQTLRTKINYQFTRSFSFRSIVEYDSLLANPLYTSLVRTKQVSTEVLFTWLPHPGTALYLGYDSDLQNINRELCNRVSGTGECDLTNNTVPRSTQYLNDGRNIFLKASYLLRF